MTGFGRVEKNNSAWQVVVEIKTVNHRFSDLNIKLPKNLSVFEPEIRKLINTSLSRGRVELYISLVSLETAAYSIGVDWGLAQSYVDTAQSLAMRFGLNCGLTAQHLLELPDLLTVEEAKLDYAALWEFIEPALRETLDQVNQMRLDEGQRLTADITMRLDKIRDAVDRIEQRSPLVTEEYAQRLSERMIQFLQEGSIEQERIIAEAALFAEKSNITEEIIRLRSHITEAHKLLEESEPVGRKLDFIVQEMNREINTIGSKANDEKIASEVIFCKAEIEKVREQAQNLE